MNGNVARASIAAALVATLIALAFWYPWSVKAAPAPSVSDIAIDEAVVYHDFHSCHLPNGAVAYDFHFGGADRSRRAQFVARHDNMGRRTMRVVTTDRTLPKGHIRLTIQRASRFDLEGHNFGTDWSTEVLQINPRRPIEIARTVPSCGPERQ